MSQLATYLQQYQTEGLSFFPIPFKTKEAVISWKEYQERQPTGDEVKKWSTSISNIAVVCGQVSGNLVILDCDTEDVFLELDRMICEKVGEVSSVLDFTRVSKTSKGYHIWFKTKEPVKSQKFPKLDIKAEGGYIIAPPSIHPTGTPYKFVNDKPIKAINSLLDIGINVNQGAETPRNQPGWVSQLLAGVGEGQRNDSAIKMAGYFRNTQPQDVTERILLDWNTRNTPPMPERDLLKVVASAYRLPEHQANGTNSNKRTCMYDASQQNENEANRNKNATENATGEANGKAKTQQAPLSQQVEEWVRTTSGWFDTQEIDRDLGINSTADKNNRREAILRLEAKGIIERHAKISKQFRFINTKVTSLQFKTASNAGVLPVKWPLGIEKYVNLFPGNEAVIAGAPNSGKTALLLNFVHLNQDNFPIYYFCSEMGEVELRSRLDEFPGMDVNDWHFKAFDRSSNFADVIRPDCVNLIDYLEMTTELYEVNKHLTDISHKLGSGLAVIALQKKENARYGRGQEFSVEKPKLYLSLDKSKLQITKGKSWAKKNVDPCGLKINFKIVGGCQFIQSGDWTHGSPGEIPEEDF